MSLSVRMFIMASDLERGATFLVRIAALNVNGSGVPTEWQSAETYQYDLDGKISPLNTSLSVREKLALE